LKFWPASDAIIANAEKTIPKLIDVIKNMDVNKTIRLRAATFLNTMDVNQLQAIMDQEAIDLRSEIQSILDQDIRWRHSLAMIGYFDRHDPTAYYELKRKQMKLPPDADVKIILKEMDECLWGKY
ncbi:MAG: hypothetical protein ACP5I1_14170, partial [Candidatus Hinthialibacter sp.]